MPLDRVSSKRAEVYQWFAQLLHQELTDRQLEQLDSREHREWVASLAAIPGMSENAVAFECSRERILTREDRQQELAADYATLLLTGPPLGVSPYAGHYPHTSPAESRLEMRRLLVRYQLAPVESEAVDHIAIQLALMAALIDGNASREEQCHFVHTHLMSWLPVFSNSCATRDKEGFYATAIRLIVGFIEQDEIWLTGEI